MKNQFTNHDLIRYAYGEVSFLEKVAIEKALKTDLELANEFEKLQKSRQKLDEVELMPSVHSIQAILNYSSSSHYETEFS